MGDENLGLELMKVAAEGAGREGVDKLANFFGAALPFWGMRKRAVDAYVKAIENGNYTADEKYLLIAGARKHCRELENQMAIAEIAQQVAADRTDFSMHSQVDDEWLSRFMDAGKFVSDEETRLLWGNVLAGEFESPGSTPPSIIRILSELTKRYATIFSAICSLRVEVLADDGTDILEVSTYPLIFTDRENTYLDDLGITFSALQELKGLGLIDADHFSGFVYEMLSKDNFVFHVISEKHVITISECKDNRLPIGNVRLTEAGQCISRFVPKTYNADHMRAIAASLPRKNGIKCLESPLIEITEVIETETGTEYNYQRLPKAQQQTPEQQ